MDLLDAFPRPRLVRAGVDWIVLPWRLGDLATLQAYLRDSAGDPLAGRRGPLRDARAAAGGDYLADSPEGRAYAALLRDLRPACEAWPPPLRGPESAAALASPAGLRFWLQLLLSRTHPGFGPEQAGQLLQVLDAESYRALDAAAHAEHPLDELCEAMDPTPRRTRSGGVDWAAEVLALVWPPPGPMGAARPRLSFAEAEALYLPQWLLLRSRGEYRPGEPRGFPARVAAVTRRWEKLYGEDGQDPPTIRPAT